MSEQLDREDRAIEVALQRCLEQGDNANAIGGMEAADEALVREYTELLGLLPYELEPATPSLSTKVRLLAKVGGDAGASGSMATRAESPTFTGPVGVPTPERSVDEMTFQAAGLEGASENSSVSDELPTYERSAVDVTLRHAAAGEAVENPAEMPSGVQPLHPVRPAAPTEGYEPVPSGYYGQAPPRNSWATWAMAAMLGVCMLGMGFLIGQSREQVAKIAHLEDELQQQVVIQEPNVVSLRDDLDTAKRRLRMVTEVAQSVYPMRTVSAPAEIQDAPPGGTIYVCGQHQRWYLNVQGLEPPTPGKEYHLWFITEDGTIDGGVLEVGEGAMAEKDANSMPPGTRGFSVTLEDVGVRDSPQGLMVLLGEQAVSL